MSVEWEPWRVEGTLGGHVAAVDLQMQSFSSHIGLVLASLRQLAYPLLSASIQEVN